MNPAIMITLAAFWAGVGLLVTAVAPALRDRPEGAPWGPALRGALAEHWLMAAAGLLLVAYPFLAAAIDAARSRSRG